MLWCEFIVTVEYQNNKGLKPKIKHLCAIKQNKHLI